MLNDGLQNGAGTPIISLIEASVNTLVHLTVIVLIQTRLLTLVWWKKAAFSALSLPQLVGFIFWLISDTYKVRLRYLITMYFSFATMVTAGAVEFFYLCEDYLDDGLEVEKLDLITVGSLLLAYSVSTLFLVLGFQDYVFLETSLENGVDPFKD